MRGCCQAIGQKEAPCVLQANWQPAITDQHESLGGSKGWFFTSDGVQVWNRERSRKSTYDLVKMKLNRSLKRSHKGNGIGVGRIRTLPFSSDSAYDSVAHGLVKIRLLESKHKRKEKSITTHVPTLCDWFSSFASACDSDDLVYTSSLTTES